MGQAQCHMASYLFACAKSVIYIYIYIYIYLYKTEVSVGTTNFQVSTTQYLKN